MSRPVRNQDLRVIDAVIAYVRECQAGMLGLSATPIEVSPGGRPSVGNSQAEYVAQFCLCGRRVFYGKRLDVFRSFYAQLRSLDDLEAERIARTELGMTNGEFESHCAAIENSRKFADELRAHQMYRRWMQEPQEQDFVSRNAGDNNGMRTLSQADAIQIRSHFRRDCRVSVLAKFYNVADSTISRIVRGESWR